MPAGRPSKYNPEYCDRVIEMGEQGYSVVEMAAELRVDRSTLEGEWVSAHEEFSQAFKLSRMLSQAWWEKQGRMNLMIPQGGGNFKEGLWSRNMAARFPADWRENKGVELTGPGGGAVKVEEVRRTIVDPKA